MMQFLIFFLFPALELYFLIAFGQSFGILAVFGWIILTAIAGGWVLRQYIPWYSQRYQVELQAGVIDPRAGFHIPLLFLGGILLILPGLMTDTFGALLLLPFMRTWIIDLFPAYLEKMSSRQRSWPGGNVFFYSMRTETQQQPRHPDDVVIDCVVRETTDEHSGKEDRTALVFDCDDKDDKKKS